MSEAGHDEEDRVSAAGQTDGRREELATGGGILGALPRTRPQRSSPRRAAARARSAKRPDEPKGPGKAGGASRPKGATRRGAGAKRAARGGEPSVPRQGYEPEEEPRIGTTVHPPSGAELVESVADIFVELASAGLKAGGRALKDALSPLRRS